MEEKKYVKISLGTAICLFIILLLVIGMVGMYFYFTKENDNIIKDVNDINNNIGENIEEQIEVDINKDTENEISLNNSNKFSDEDNKYQEITSQLDGIDVLYVTDAINNDDNTYTLKGVIYTQYTLTEKELRKLEDDKTIKINDLVYTLTERNENGEYELVTTEKNMAQYVIKELNSNTYYLTVPYVEISDVWKLSDEYRQITIPKNTTCITAYPEEEESTVKEVFANFNESNPIDTTNPDSTYTYKFTFEDEKCTGVINYMTSM